MWLGYFFDCMDGHYARAYNMTTKWGDYYDHISDMITLSLFVYIFISMYRPLLRQNRTIAYTILLIVLCMGFLMGKHIGCQELHHAETSHYLSQSHSLHILKSFCNSTDELTWTRHFGIGTSFLIFYTIAMGVMLYYS